MKKNETKDQEQKQPRRLRLNRETIRLLNDPALLGLARGGETNPCVATGPDPLSEVNHNCYPITCSGTTTTTTTDTRAL
jgi:hypothetical protein